MQKSFAVLSILLIISLLLLMACAAVQELIQPPRVSIDSVKITGASFQDISLNFDLLVRNPNQFGARLMGFDYSFALEGREFVTGQESREISVPAASAAHLSIPVTLDFQRIYQLAKEFKALDSLSYTLKGHLKPAGVLAGLSIPFQKSGSLPNIRVPKISFSGLKIKKLGFTGVDLELGLNIDNNNIFGFDIGKFDYRIKLAGSEVASGLVNNLASVPKKGSTEIKLPISLSFGGLAGSLRSALSGSKVDCAILGKAELKSPFGLFNLPIDAQQEIPIFK